MTYSAIQNSLETLQETFALLQTPTAQGEATQKFTDLVDQVAQTSETAELLTAMWQEIVAARRSAAFWEQLSDVEKSMSEQLAANNIRLQQNYLRLMQEQ